MTPMHKIIGKRVREITPFIERSLKDDEKFEALNLQDCIEDALLEVAALAYEDAAKIADTIETNKPRNLEYVTNPVYVSQWIAELIRSRAAELKESGK